MILIKNLVKKGNHLFWVNDKIQKIPAYYIIHELQGHYICTIGDQSTTGVIYSVVYVNKGAVK